MLIKIDKAKKMNVTKNLVIPRFWSTKNVNNNYLIIIIIYIYDNIRNSNLLYLYLISFYPSLIFYYYINIIQLVECRNTLKVFLLITWYIIVKQASCACMHEALSIDSFSTSVSLHIPWCAHVCLMHVWDPE